MKGSLFYTALKGWLTVLILITLDSTIATEALESIFPDTDYKSNSTSKRFPTASNREPKFLFPQTMQMHNPLVKVTPMPCFTLNKVLGACYTPRDCKSLGGQSDETVKCGRGYGRCCIIEAKCGSTVTVNATILKNTNKGHSFYSKFYTFDPYTDEDNNSGGIDSSGTCHVKIKKQKNVCQIRLDFLKFDIAGPEWEVEAQKGSCLQDSLTITAPGEATRLPKICGNMEHQHIYVNFGSGDVIHINLFIAKSIMQRREWAIQVLMIPCNSPVIAPPGCLQYFLGSQGKVESFNYKNEIGGIHLANMDYSICFRTEEGFKSIEYAPCTPGGVEISGARNFSGSFTTTTNMTPPMSVVHSHMITTAGPFRQRPLNPCTIRMENIKRKSKDYLIIPQGVSMPFPGNLETPTSFTDRYCDASWESNLFDEGVHSVKTWAQPFLIHFYTDDKEISEKEWIFEGRTPHSSDKNQTLDGFFERADASRGFCLRYIQNF